MSPGFAGATWPVHVGLLLAAVGTLLPWATVATRSRTGFSTAELLLSVADAGAPDAFLALGALWYASAAATIAAWVFATLGTSRRLRRLGLWSGAVGALGWLVFGAWALVEDRLDIRGGGWALTTLGTATIAVTIWRRRT